MLLCTYYSYDFLGYSLKTSSFTYLLILLSFSCPSSYTLGTTPSMMFLQRKKVPFLVTIYESMYHCMWVTLNNKKIFVLLYKFYITIIIKNRKSLLSSVNLPLLNKYLPSLSSDTTFIAQNHPY